MLSTSPVTSAPACSVIERVRTLVVDGHPLVREALRALLASQLEFDLVSEAGSLAEANACVAREALDLAIVDLVLPDGSGLAFVDHLLNVQPDCRVLALSAVEEPTQMAEMLRAGADGFVMKSQPTGELLEALHCVIHGGRSVPAVAREHIERLLDSPDAWPLERLTPREREVFDLLVAGYTNAGIATKLAISRRTVETHRFRLMSKLSARSLGELLQLAVRHGLLG